MSSTLVGAGGDLRRWRGRRAAVELDLDGTGLELEPGFDRASQLRAYVASLSAFGWTMLLGVMLIALGWSRSPLAVTDGWAWTAHRHRLVASSLGSYFWNIGASRLGVR